MTTSEDTVFRLKSLAELIVAVDWQNINADEAVGRMQVFSRELKRTLQSEKMNSKNDVGFMIYCRWQYHNYSPSKDMWHINGKWMSDDDLFQEYLNK